MQKIVLILGFTLLVSVTGISQKLQISDNGKYIETEEGEAFFWLGDTAWELFHRLNLHEARLYLKNRADKGFTVIQAVLLSQLGGLTIPNSNGDLPLLNQNPEEPNGKYFDHVQDIVNIADSLGLYIGMLPTWGSYWSTVNSSDVIFTKENARLFGEYLGQRYRNSNVIWIMGGDENINNDNERKIIENMALGLKAGDDGMHLITYHPRGPGQSSTYYHNAEWLDFNMYQSSHAGHDHDNGLYAEHDLKLTPQKPTLDGEPRYELIPVSFYFSGANRLDLFKDDDARQAAYWSILAGACGHTYGHNSIWQMYTSDREPVIGAKVPWYNALDHAGSYQMGYLRKLFEARPFHKLVPDQSIILNGPMFGAGKIRAAVAGDSSFAIVYSPLGMPFTIDQNRIQAEKLKAIWFDPRYGISHPFTVGNTFAIQTYTPPSNGKGNDWILIIEADEMKFRLP